MSEELRIVLVSALPTVPSYFLGLYTLRFLLTPRSKKHLAAYAAYCLVVLTSKPIVDFYWQLTNEGRSLAILHGMIMALSLPLVLLFSFRDDWRRTMFLVFPFVCIESVFIMPVIIYMLQSGLPLRPAWQLAFFAGTVVACLLAALITDRLARLVEKLPPPVYTALAAASPVVNVLFNLEQALQSLNSDSRLETAAILSWQVAVEALVLVLVFFWLLRRQAWQTVAIAAARETMHQRAVEAQQRNLTALRALRREHRESLEAVEALLADDRPAAALDKVRALTRQSAPAARRYADNPVADVLLADAARRCAEAGVTLTVQGSLPRDCTLPPVDLASLLYNLLSNAVTAAAEGPRPGRVEIRFVTAAGRLCLTVENTKGPQSARRSRGAGHGFGRKILREITARYDGSYTLEYGDDWAVATAMVCLPAPKEETRDE